jgi:ankyrin repeat protein
MSQKVLAVPSASGAPGPVAINDLRLRGGFAGDDVWRVLLELGEGLFATSLSFCDLTRLGRLRDNGVNCLYISAAYGHLEVVKALLEAGGRELVMRTKDDEVSCLYISAQAGHLEVVNALLEAGGRELVMLTRYNGASCLYISGHEGHLEVVKALLEAGGRSRSRPFPRILQVTPSPHANNFVIGTAVINTKSLHLLPGSVVDVFLSPPWFAS